jgi:hypothetical protein
MPVEFAGEGVGNLSGQIATNLARAGAGCLGPTVWDVLPAAGTSWTNDNEIMSSGRTVACVDKSLFCHTETLSSSPAPMWNLGVYAAVVGGAGRLLVHAATIIAPAITANHAVNRLNSFAPSLLTCDMRLNSDLHLN